LSLTLLSRKTPPNDKVGPEGRWIALFVSLPLPLLFAWLLWGTLVVPSYWLQQAQSAHIRGQSPLEFYEAALDRAGALRPEIQEKYGIALLDAGQYEKAKEQFQLALKESDSGSVWLGLGTAEYLLGHRSAAFTPLEKAVYRWPSHVDAWRLLLRVCPEKSRDERLKKAERFLSAKDVKALSEDVAVIKPEQPKPFP
jgi:tetratricopeptide (TPR) repeat protein